jgi:hypothetical protein
MVQAKLAEAFERVATATKAKKVAEAHVAEASQVPADTSVVPPVPLSSETVCPQSDPRTPIIAPITTSVKHRKSRAASVAVPQRILLCTTPARQARALKYVPQ